MPLSGCLAADTPRYAAELPFKNEPRSDERVRNSRGHYLHVRTLWPPEDTAPKALLFFFHGYGSHTNRPQQIWIARQLAARGIACIYTDFHGHGYSEGYRCHTTRYNHLVDDAMSVILAVSGCENGDEQGQEGTRSDSGAETPPESGRFTSQLNEPACGWKTVRAAPMFLCGHSMGGATAIVLGHTLSSHARLSGIFRGAILLCPALQTVARLPAVAVGVLHAVARIFPKVLLSQLIIDPTEGWEDVWVAEEMREYVRGDGYPRNPDGLAWGLNPRLSTASSLVAIMQRAKKVAAETTYPFLILHDPEEKVVDIAGTHYFMENATAEDKTLVLLANGRHDLICNLPEHCFQEMYKWIARVTE